MGNILDKFNTLLTVVIATLVIEGCSQTPIREWPAIEGLVLDSSNGKPVAGVFVITVWKGYAGPNSQSQYFHQSITITDSIGKFETPAWVNPDKGTSRLSDQTTYVYALYKTGYTLSGKTYTEQSQRHGLYYVERDISSKDRLDYLVKLSKALNHLEVNKLLQCQAMNELYLEARSLVSNKDDEKRLIWIADSYSFILYEDASPSSYTEAISYLNDLFGEPCHANE